MGCWGWGHFGCDAVALVPLLSTHSQLFRAVAGTQGTLFPHSPAFSPCLFLGLGFFPPACAWGLGFFPPVCAWVLVFSTAFSWGLFFFPSVPGFWFLTIVFAGQHQLCHCFSLFGAIRLHPASPGKRGIRALAMRRDGGTETAQGEIWGMS